MAGIPQHPRPVGAIPDGKIVDFLTGRLVRDTPEEYVRQNIEKALVRQYEYAASLCEPEFSIKVGSARKRVDIAVFEPGQPHTQENIAILVETKKAGTKAAAKKDGVEQLKSYMSACLNAKYGIWTNGDDRHCFARRASGGRHTFEEIIDVPGAGRSEDEALRPKRKDLKPATEDNLLFAFRRCHNYISHVEGMHKDEAFWELLKLIFCKIEDERSGVISFYVTPTELANSTTAAPAKARLQSLFAAKVVQKYPKIFDTAETQTIGLKPKVVAYVVSQLQGFSLLDSKADVKGIAYEEIVGSNLRGDKGEFFTPRNACRMAVDMLQPGSDELILDPACGTGGFLITGMNVVLDALETTERAEWADPENPTPSEYQELYRKRTEYLSQHVVGLDINPALVRAAKMNMVMNNDGEGGLFRVDSLENPHTWDAAARNRVPLGSIDVIVTNPPFGANIIIDDEDVLAQYELAAVWDQEGEASWSIRRDRSDNPVLQANQPPEILFIERCVRWLKKGSGRMAMVVPNGILNNPSLGYVRHWILLNTQVLAIVDMDRDLFQPGNDTQTSMVLLRRLSDAEIDLAARKELDYSVFMAVAEKIGHDKRGNLIYRHNAQGEDILVEREESVVEIDPGTGAEVRSTLTIRERAVDDELPEVAVAYRSWLEDLA